MCLLSLSCRHPKTSSTVFERGVCVIGVEMTPGRRESRDQVGLLGSLHSIPTCESRQSLERSLFWFICTEQRYHSTLTGSSPGYYFVIRLCTGPLPTLSGNMKCPCD